MTKELDEAYDKGYRKGYEEAEEEYSGAAREAEDDGYARAEEYYLAEISAMSVLPDDFLDYLAAKDYLNASRSLRYHIYEKTGKMLDFIVGAKN